MSDPIQEAKAQLRKAVLARRDALSPAEHTAHRARITEQLQSLDSLREARRVMAYMSIGSEFDTRAFVDHVLSTGKTLVLPRVAGKQRLALHVVRNLQTDLQAGVWGIREPVAERTQQISPAQVDWILVPGVAFTLTGARLGYGGGYYDALLAEAPQATPRIAAAFSLQIVDTVPTSARDQPVTQVVTELD